jgi:IS1 family transposase
VIQKKQTLQEQLHDDITRAETEESLLQAEESQFESLMNQIQEKQIALGQLTSELAITEAEIHQRSPFILKSDKTRDCESQISQIREELAQLETILKTKRQSLSELQSQSIPTASVQREIDDESVKSFVILSELDEIRDKISALGDDSLLTRVLLAEIEEIPVLAEKSDDENNMLRELRMLDRSRREFEAFRAEKLAVLEEDLRIAKNSAYIKLLKADRRKLQHDLRN